MRLKELTEQKAELLDRCQAISKVAEDEKRGLSEEEQKETDGILAQVDKIIGDIKREEKLQAHIKDLQASRNPVPATVPSDGPKQEPKPKIPAVARYVHRSLRAFKGPDAMENAYKTGKFVAGFIFGDASSRQWCIDAGMQIRAAQSEGDNAKGGVLVPEQMESTIIRLREERGVMAMDARLEPMASDTKVIPRDTGDLTVYYVGENTEVTGSDATYDNIRLTAKKPAILVRMSTELDEDSVVSMGDQVATKIGYGFADAEDKAGFIGDGTSTYGGIKGLISEIAAGSKVTAATGNTAFSTLDLDDFESMVGKLPKYAEQNAKWYIHKAGWAASMLRLQAAAGGNTIADIGAGATLQFLGFPVVHVQVMNSTLAAQTSTDGLCYFGDLNQGVALGRRRGVTIFQSRDRYMELDQIGILGTQRYDINVHESGDASNAGSVIMLSTPSS